MTRRRADIKLGPPRLSRVIYMRASERAQWLRFVYEAIDYTWTIRPHFLSRRSAFHRSNPVSKGGPGCLLVGSLVSAFLREARGDINPLTFINRRRMARELRAECVSRRAFPMPNITWLVESNPDRSGLTTRDSSEESAIVLIMRSYTYVASRYLVTSIHPFLHRCRTWKTDFRFINSDYSDFSFTR